MEKLAYCPICKKKFRTRSGLQGHFRFKHRFEYDSGEPVRETAFMRAIKSAIEKKKLGDEIVDSLEDRFKDSAIEKRRELRDIEKEEKKAKETDLGGLNLEW